MKLPGAIAGTGVSFVPGSRVRDASVPPVGTRSWWLEEALRADPGRPCPPLDEDVTADVCVIGGGFAGLWTAYELTERAPSTSIVLLESDVCGAGGSGANGGFFSPSWTSLEALCQALGEEGGVRWATALADEVPELGRWVARHDARIDFHHEGILFARVGEWQSRGSAETFRLLEGHGLASHLTVVDAAEARSVADSPRFSGGLVTSDLATVQPAKLARELRRVLLERGVSIFEGTPMTWIQSGAAPRVETPKGAVTAGEVVLATGSWAVREPHFRRAFAVCLDYMVVTEPIPELLRQVGWQTYRGIADSRELAYYLRRTDDDRIAIGGGSIGSAYGGRFEGRASTSARLAEIAAQGLGWLFPSMEDVGIDAAWSGPMDMTSASIPFFESSADGHLHAGLGFSGHGLTSTRVGGRILASLVLHEDDQWTSLPVVGPPISRVPPEPVRWPLVSLVAWANESGDRRRDQGRPRGFVRDAVTRAFDAYAAGRRRVPGELTLTNARKA
jgi:glycine/D-amino acid oxidase-like deaminating enzyme